MKVIHLLPEIERPVWKKAGDHDCKKYEHGRHHNNAKIPSETILSMRRMHEIERRTTKEVQAAFPDLHPEYVRSVLGYLVRVNLRVKP